MVWCSPQLGEQLMWIGFYYLSFLSSLSSAISNIDINFPELDSFCVFGYAFLSLFSVWGFYIHN